MQASRREFIRHVGVALASLLTTRCVVGCYAPLPPTSTPGASKTPTPNPLWLQLRGCWLDLDDPRLQSFDDNDFIIDLRKRHADVLQSLVDAGELDPDVADRINIAFEQAVVHVQRKMAECYIMLPPEFAPREDLVQQAAVLEKIAEKGDVEPATVRLAQEALERDITWLAQFQSGQVTGTLEDVEADAASVEAAQILIELLVGELQADG